MEHGVADFTDELVNRKDVSNTVSAGLTWSHSIASKSLLELSVKSIDSEGSEGTATLDENVLRYSFTWKPAASFSLNALKRKVAPLDPLI